MRLVFFLLLLANLGVFAWYGWLATPEKAGDVYRQPVEEDRLALVDEPTEGPAKKPAEPDRTDADPESPQPETTPDDAGSPAGSAAAGDPSTPEETSPEESQTTNEADVSPEAESPAETQPAGAAERICVSYGPYPTEERAAAAGARLQRAGLETERRRTEGRLRVGYWVYLPPLPDEEAAEAVTEKLRENDFTDFYIVRSGDRKNAVSLGVFSDTARADRRAARIGQMGFKPRITDRYREATVFWLDVSAPPRKLPPAEKLRQYAGAAGDVRRKERDCPTD